MVDLVAIAGVIFGAAGLCIGLYSQYKQKKFERQFERKQELQHLSEDLEDLRHRLEIFIQTLENPENDEDTLFDLRNLSRDVLAYSHSTETPATVQVTRLVALSGGEEKEEIETVEQGIDACRQGNKIFSTIAIQDTGDVFSESFAYSLGAPVMSLGRIYDEVDSVKEAHQELLSQFAPELLAEIESTMDEVTAGILQNMIEGKEGVEVDPSDYEDASLIILGIYDKLIRYENIEGEISQLEEFNQEIEDLRTTVLQTSYS
jgi:hypothetical protein